MSKIIRYKYWCCYSLADSKLVEFAWTGLIHAKLISLSTICHRVSCTLVQCHLGVANIPNATPTYLLNAHSHIEYVQYALHAGEVQGDRATIEQPEKCRPRAACDLASSGKS